MAELSRILGDGTQKVRIYPGENQVEFVTEETILFSRLIEGSFPDYAQIIPKSSQTEVEVTTPEFANAIKMASLFARESANNIKLKIAENKPLEVLAVSPHVGDNVSSVEGKIKGEALEIAFNAKFILDCLQVLGSEKVTLSLSGNLAAGMLRSTKDLNYLYVIMPLRTEE